MSTGKTLQTQIQIEPVEGRESTNLFTPPGIFIESSRYPTVTASILASSSPSEHLSLFDHPECWGGLAKNAILSMRRRLYQLKVPLDARRMEPSEIVEKIQQIALSVSPVALQITSNGLPPTNLVTNPGQLPSGAEVSVDSLEVISDPQISRVAEAITQKDIPAAQGVWQLLEYDYSLDQAARLMAVGLLGKIKNRRIITTRGAYKATIDAFINHTVLELAEKPIVNGRAVFASTLFTDKFTILLRPGEPTVDYLRMDTKPSGTDQGYSLEGDRRPASDAKSSLYADHARYSAYRYLLANGIKAHITIFHSSSNPRNNTLGPWIAREGVKKALASERIRVGLGQTDSELLKGILSPNPRVWESSLPFSVFDDATETVAIVV